MNTVDDDKKALLLGLDEDAQKEAEKMRADAEKALADRRAYVEKQAESILSEAQKKAKAQADAIKSSILSGVKIEATRNSMKQREQTIGAILEKVERELSALADTPRYREVLIDWIAEAAVGLGAKQARVNASARERRLIDNEMLKQATRKASLVLGHDIALELDDAGPLAAQGVVVTAHDGRTAYNNQVKTRLMRRQTEIRNLIHDELYGGQPSGENHNPKG